MDKNSKYLIKKSNDLINLPQKLSLNEARIFLSMVSQIKSTDKDFKTYRITFRDLERLIGGSKNNFSYGKVKNILDSLMSHVVTIKIDEHQEYKTHYIQSAKIDRGNGYVDLEFDNRMRPFLLELSERYTRYELGYVLPLRSYHSIRIYELLKQYEKLDERVFSLDEFKKILNVENYKLYGDIKKRVILQAKKEINESTDLAFDFDEIKQGRKVIGLRFFIHKNYKNDFTYNNSEYKDILQKLISLGLQEKSAKELLNSRMDDLDKVSLSIDYAITESKKQDITNVPGFIIYCIEHGFKKKVKKTAPKKEDISLIKFEEEKNEKLDKLIEQYSNEETKKQFILYMKNKFSKHYTQFLGKTPEKFSIKNMVGNNFFRGFLEDKYLEDHEKSYEIYLKNNKK